MKDVQGIERGKCNSCECIEYRPPPESGKLSCEYCGHRPTEHVRIVELGRCRTKGCDCDKYTSEVPNSYSECEYCGCSASTHEGADALRKKQQPHQAPQFTPQTATVPVMSVAGQMMTQQQSGMMGQPGKTGTPQATPVTSAGAHAGQPPPNAAKATAAASTAPAHSDVQKVHSKPSKPGKELVRVVLSPETLIIILYKTL
ncbi:hypothetical protein GBAR_LOCUS11342 [Geodia barretti]|uniref:Uncharacterized protein n=1 Tax=Geodia barretti TaxID=519541 RepID=A0AA35WLG5_GEOBA|nr:hypothetical protein GBAR_LOCUS11342 [Geodia barretti]